MIRTFRNEKNWKLCRVSPYWQWASSFSFQEIFEISLDSLYHLLWQEFNDLEGEMMRFRTGYRIWEAAKKSPSMQIESIKRGAKYLVNSIKYSRQHNWRQNGPLCVYIQLSSSSVPDWNSHSFQGLIWKFIFLDMFVMAIAWSFKLGLAQHMGSVCDCICIFWTRAYDKMR